MAKMPIAVLGIDLGKNSCSVAGLDANGAVVLRRRMGRDGLVTFASKLPRLGETDQRFRQAQLDGMVRRGETR